MSVLQWALLIVGIVAVIAIYVISRREKRPVKSWTPPSVGVAPKPPAGDQMEIFSRPGEFDEFGVGKPRKRVGSIMPGVPETPLPLEEAPVEAAAPAAKAEPIIAAPTASAAPAPAATKPAEQKIIAILIAEREGGLILGSNLHRALRNEGLVYGERKIYHRMDLGRPVFSVAGLLKPGQLDPAESDKFVTPGLTMFMVLPGAPAPVDAVRDMLITAKALAKGLKSELFDNKRQPFTETAERAMLADIEDWARRNA